MVRLKHRYLLLNILYPDNHPKQISNPEQVPAGEDFLAFHRPSPSHLNAPLLLNQIRTTISHLHGDLGLGLASSSLKVVYLSPATSTAIIRCPRAHFRLVWTALTFMTEIPGQRAGRGRAEVNGTKCVMRVVRVSGTIRKAEEDLIRRARQEVVRARTIEEGKGDEVLVGLLARVDAGVKGKVTNVESDVELNEDFEASDEEDEDEAGLSE